MVRSNLDRFLDRSQSTFFLDLSLVYIKDARIEERTKEIKKDKRWGWENEKIEG